MVVSISLWTWYDLHKIRAIEWPKRNIEICFMSITLSLFLTQALKTFPNKDHRWHLTVISLKIVRISILTFQDRLTWPPSSKSVTADLNLSFSVITFGRILTFWAIGNQQLVCGSTGPCIASCISNGKIVSQLKTSILLSKISAPIVQLCQGLMEPNYESLLGDFFSKRTQIVPQYLGCRQVIIHFTTFFKYPKEDWAGFLVKHLNGCSG